MRIASAFFLLLGSTLASAQAPSVASYVPPKPQTFVVDSAHLLSPATVTSLRSTIHSLQTATRADIAVVTLPTVGDRSVGDVALAIGRAWGVGGQADVGDVRRNTGIVLLVVPKSASGPRKSSLQVSRGLEGYITDGDAGEIRRGMVVYTKQDKYDQGLTFAVDSIARQIRNRMAGELAAQETAHKAPAPKPAPEPDHGALWLGLFFLGLALTAVLVYLLKRRPSRSTPPEPTSTYRAPRETGYRSSYSPSPVYVPTPTYESPRETPAYETPSYDTPTYEAPSAPEPSGDSFGGSGGFSGGGSSSDNDG